MEFKFPYGKTYLKADIPDSRISRVMENNLDAGQSETEQEELVRRSLEKPVGSPRLSEMAVGKRKVVLLASDHTRPVPSKIIIPLMLEEIRSKNPGAEITILIATGCHRGSRKEELLEKFGREVYENERIVIHDCDNREELVFLDTLPSGGQLVLNRLAVEADLLVAEGFIEPHFFAGYSGGRKSVLPGVASREAVYYNHNSAFIDDPYSRMGSLDKNPIHRDMIFAAKRARLSFIVNVVIDSRKQVVASFAGDCDLAHRAGCDFLNKKAAEYPVRSDIVITTNNGYPLDQNIYQAVKGMCTAEATCRPGGVIISIAECSDGVGGDAFYETFRSEPSADAILEDFRRRTAAETVEDQWQSQIFARILSRHKVIFVSGMPDEIVRDVHLIPAGTVEEALNMADSLLGKKDGSICVILEGVSTMILPDNL